MAADQIAPLAVLPLTNGCTLVAEARDPTSFNIVAGLVVSKFTFYAIDSGGDTAAPPPAPPNVNGAYLPAGPEAA